MLVSNYRYFILCLLSPRCYMSFFKALASISLLPSLFWFLHLTTVAIICHRLDPT